MLSSNELKARKIFYLHFLLCVVVIILDTFHFFGNNSSQYILLMSLFIFYYPNFKNDENHPIHYYGNLTLIISVYGTFAYIIHQYLR